MLIPKPGKPGKTRPLVIPAINDRLVQEVIRSIIEPIFELNFSNQSHGFRPNRSCHTALKWVNTHMKDCPWFIEGDIKSYFPTVNHRILMRFVRERIQDPIILGLIRDGLKAKVFTKHDLPYEPSVGTPQGGILSPLLSNIYLDKFDKYMEDLIRELETPNSKPRRNPEIDKLYKKNNKSEIYRLRVLHPRDINHIRIRYIRYADDFVIGINGSLELAHEIKQRISE